MLPKPPNGYLESAAAKDLMNRFVNGGKYEGLTGLPKKVDPQQAGDFVSEVLQSPPGSLKAGQVARCGELARFHDLRSAIGSVADHLDRGEKENVHFSRSIAAIAVLGDLGDKALQEEASKYYQYLLGHRLSDQFQERLIDLFFHLSDTADPKWLTEPIKAEMKKVEPDIESDEDAAVSYYQHQDWLKDRVPTVLKAKEKKEKILKQEKGRRQRSELIRLYLRYGRSAYVDLSSWAMMILQRDCSEANPPELGEAFLRAFDLIISEAGRKGSLSTGDREDLNTYVTGCARGVEFYGGQFNEEQSKFASEHQNQDQNNTLWWEPDSPE